MVQDLEASNSGIVLAFLESSQLPRTQRENQQHALQSPVRPREAALEETASLSFLSELLDASEQQGS